MSIATKSGDTGQTALAGGTRISKAALRVDTYGNVDELNANLGLARALCDDKDISNRTKLIQSELFLVGSALSAPPDAKNPKQPVTSAMVEALTAQVHELEAIPGMLSDWSIPGEHAAAAAYDVARTVCRRAERSVVALVETGEAVDSNVIAYLNRLSDLLWLYGRKLERDAGKDASLRKVSGKSGPNFSRAW
jgi:cob(I)alamin adenosyltransferase